MWKSMCITSSQNKTIKTNKNSPHRLTLKIHYPQVIQLKSTV